MKAYYAHVETYDVWGNEIDGFVVNDVYSHDTWEVTDKEIETTQDIVTLLNNEFFENPVDSELLEIEGDDQDVYITERETGRPILGIHFEIYFEGSETEYREIV